MSWQLQFLIVYMCIYRSDMDIASKGRMLEIAYKDFGISKEEFDSFQKMVKKETLEATTRFMNYSNHLLTKLEDNSESGGDVNEYV